MAITEKAEDDLAEIWAFIAEHSPDNATRFVNQLEEACFPLLDNPMLGPAREELSPGLRVHFFRKYAIYYIPTDLEIIIIRVIHLTFRTLFCKLRLIFNPHGALMG